MSFKILYQGGTDVGANIFSIAAYVNSFAKHLGLQFLNVNPSGIQQVAAALARPDFPHADGLDKASPFKKAANFFVWFVVSRPVLDELPATIVTKELASIPNHQNVVFGYHMAVDCLHGAELYKGDQKVPLPNRIHVSAHFFHDFVETYAAATPQADFKPLSLLFEQLAYKANPGASYPEVI